MALSPGRRLAHFEVLSPLGAGGMGEVFRARDTKLGRDVALKVLSGALADNPERRARLEREARLLATLNHPGIAAIHGLEDDAGIPVLVMELVEGETLDLRLDRGPLPVRQALEVARQVAEGLEAAHEKGIIHRDLKPSNVKLTPEGKVKLLDFGLAKVLEVEVASSSDATLTTPSDDPTGSGVVLGTAPYMSPEQARGEELDRRTDIWSFGCVLYEMLAGKRAFPGRTRSDAIAAVLEREPDWKTLPATTPVKVEDLLHRCLQKDKADRLHDIGDARIELREAQAETTSGAALVAPSPTVRWRKALLLATAVIAAIAVGFVAGGRLERKPVPSYRQLTFRRGIVDQARFASDGQTVVYSARWEGKPSEVFAARLDLAEAQALSLAQDAHLDGVHGGEALVRYKDGRLARMPLVGGTPRDVAENVTDSDWGPTGDIACIRRKSVAWGRFHLEYPIGKILLESPYERPLREPRVSPGGDRVALIVGGNVVVVHRDGHQAVLSTGWMEADGLAWSPDGREVWFTAGGPARSGAESVGTLKELHAVSLAGRERLLLRMAGDLTLKDVLRDNRVLLSHGRTRIESRGKLAGDQKERDFTYLDGTMTVGISADGRAVLFQESAQAGGPRNTSYLRRVGDSSPIRLGEGAAAALSPDGRRAIVSSNAYESGSRFVLLSAGAEPPRELPHATLDAVGWAWWTPDGQRVILTGREKGRGWRAYIQEPPDGQPRPISTEATGFGTCGAPGKAWATCVHDQEDKGRRIHVWELYSLDGGVTRPAPWIGQDDSPIAWSADGRYVFLAGYEQPPFRVFRVEVAAGRRETWLDTSPPDPAGISRAGAGATALTPDGRYYAYAYFRTLSDLFLVEGLR